MRGRWRWILALAIGVVAAFWQRRKDRRPGGMNTADHSRVMDAPGPRLNDQRSRDTHSMSRADLYQEAKRLGIPGRSKMGRDELIEAMARVRH